VTLSKLLNRIGRNLPKEHLQKIKESDSFFILEDTYKLGSLLEDCYYSPEINYEGEIVLPLNKDTVQVIPHDIYALHSKSRKVYSAYRPYSLGDRGYRDNIFAKLTGHYTVYTRIYVIGKQRCLFIQEVYGNSGHKWFEYYDYASRRWRQYFTTKTYVPVI